ncbi:rhodanese-like domain-containing protein [Reichenbachiella versicolor]|uniref:rhodanese-like domain-containing protein n=1 Tax=Reichenbachiella versicolor TaxID=1821036 RepID=UPI000D6E727E|nr:rhodanese-like domain-containing protein [Reichenbachiella versicolor]
MGLLDKLLGIKTGNLSDYVKKGAIIIDVRTPAEFQGGHAFGSKNIPLNSVKSKISLIKEMNKPIIMCCASGMRSGQATAILKKEGLECINGGSWTKVNSEIKR